MHCLEFRRRVVEDITASPAIRQHASRCSACARFARRTRKLDGALARALRIGAPETLAARVLLRKQMTDQTAPGAAVRADDAAPSRPPDVSAKVTTAAPSPGNVLARFAMAASIASGVAFGALSGLSATPPTLAAQVIEHVAAEPWLLDGKGTVRPADLEPVLRAVGLDLKAMPHGVIAAFPCPSRARVSLHLVLRSEQDTVTVIVMPGERIGAEQQSRRGRWQSLVVPVRHGSLAVVGGSGADLPAHAERVRTLLRWRV